MSRKKDRSGAAGYYGRMALTLCAVTAVAALLMSVVYGMTRGRIEGLAEERRRMSMSAVVPGAEVFSQLPYDTDLVDDMQVAYAGATLKGYCVQVSSDGFHGPITLMVGVDPKGNVLGVEILDHSETAGVGTKVDDPDFLGRFRGLSGTVGIGAGKNAVDAAGGATISSRAVARGVTDALAAVAKFQAEGGRFDEEGTV